MILLDANILLEMLIAGRPHKAKVMGWMKQNERQYCISMLTVHLVLHFGLKDGLKVMQIKTFLADYPKLALLPEDYVNAMKILKGGDHKDALQLAIAERVDCTHIITLDNKFSNTYHDRIQFINP